VISVLFRGLGLSFILSLAALPAQAEWSRQEQMCTFRQPLFVGASVTAGMTQYIPYYSELLSGGRARSGANPGVFVSQYYRGQTALGRFFNNLIHNEGAWMRRQRNRSVPFTNAHEHVGSSQIISMLSPEGSRHELYSQSSIIFGLDFFYWDSIRDYCGFGNPLVHRETRERVDVEFQIQQLTQDASAQGKILVLGTVTHDRPENVPIYDLNVSINNSQYGFWFPQDVSCVQSINESLRDHCQVENGCYLIDLYEMGEVLSRGDSLLFRDKEYGLYEVRPDGVHLSLVGSMYVADQVIQALESSPPSCGAE
jgi:hypothetical protein